MTIPRGCILVVDDETELVSVLVETLTREGYAARGCTSPRAAVEALETETFDILLSDLMMPGMDGLALLRAGLEHDPHLVCLIMTGQGTVQTAVEAMKSGAYDYVLKPFKLQMLGPVLERAMDLRRLRTENLHLRETVAIHQLSQVIALTVETGAILNTTAEAVLSLVGADEVSLMLLSPAGDALVVEAVRGEGREWLLGQQVPLDAGIASWVARHQEALLLHGSVAGDPRFSPLQPRSDIGSAISLPMLAAGQLVGVLNTNSRRPRRFTPGQIKALSILANTAAAALQNARLYGTLTANERRFRALIEHSSDAISLLGPDGCMQYVSPSTTRILGYTADEVVGADPAGFVHPEDLPTLRRQLNALMAEPGQSARARYRFRHKDGSWRWLEASINNLLAEPAVGALVFNYRDITHRVETEARLRLSDEILNRVAPIVLVADHDGQITYASPSLEKTLGYRPEEVLGDRWWALSSSDPAERDQRQAEIGAMARGERPVPDRPYERAVRGKDGRQHWMIWQDSHGPGQQVVGVGHDVTERKQAEDALATALEQLRNLFDHLDAVFFSIDTSRMEVLLLSPGAARLYGWPVDTLEANARFWLELAHPEDQARLLATFDHLLAGHPVRVEHRIVRPDGDVRWVEGNVKPAFDRNGGLVRLDGVITDVTGRRQREREHEAIASMAAALRTASRRAEMVPVILHEALNLLEATGTALATLDPASDEFVLEAASGDLSGYQGQHLLGTPALTSALLNEGRPYVVSDQDETLPFYVPGVPGQSREVVCVPLSGHAARPSVLWARRRLPFQRDEVRILSAVGDMARSALNRAALHDQTEQHLQRLMALREIDRAINNSFELQLTLNILLDQVRAQLGVEAAAILLLKLHSQRLEFAAGAGFRGVAGRRAALRLGEGQLGRAALERRALILPSVALAPGNPLGELGLAGEGFAAYCAVPLVSKGALLGMLEVCHRAPLTPDDGWLDFLQTLAELASTGIENASLFDGLQRTNSELLLAYETTLEGWSRALDLRDKETEGHTQRVTEMTLRLAAALGVADQELAPIRRGALLHDIGKMGIPDSILHKPGPLTDEEWVIMRRHPTYAYELLAPIAYLRSALDIPYCHHEKWDGTGYPRGLKGEQIPLAARIFAVVDVWDALRSDRPYRAAWPAERVLAHLRSLAGTHFDPRVVEAFLRLEHSLG